MKRPDSAKRRERKAGAAAQVSAARLQRYRLLILDFERAACAESAEPTSIARFCTAAGISGRTLLRAVRAVHGISVHRHLQTMRLAQARNMLLSMDPATSTVTKVAMRCGFNELGRFSLLYRKTFGETPSDTLNRSAVRSTRRTERLEQLVTS